MQNRAPVATLDLVLRDALTAGKLAGELPLAELERLDGRIQDRTGTIAYALQVRTDDEDKVRLVGTIRGQVRLPCDRCLEALVHRIDSTVDLVVVATEEEAEELSAEEEPLLVKDGILHLRELIEDEMLLSIPMVVTHAKAGDEPSCGVVETYRAPVKPGPFAILKSLKNDDHT